MSSPDNERAAIAGLARTHHMSEGAIAHLLDALRRGNGSAAQFNHPELGGMGQWMAGGMIMIGDGYNHALKATIAHLCAELAPLATRTVAPSGGGFPAFPGLTGAAPGGRLNWEPPRRAAHRTACATPTSPPHGVWPWKSRVG